MYCLKEVRFHALVGAGKPFHPKISPSIELKLVSLQVDEYIEVKAGLLWDLEGDIDVARLGIQCHREVRECRLNGLKPCNDSLAVDFLSGHDNATLYSPKSRSRPALSRPACSNSVRHGLPSEPYSDVFTPPRVLGCGTGANLAALRVAHFRPKAAGRVHRPGRGATGTWGDSSRSTGPSHPRLRGWSRDTQWSRRQRPD